MTEYVNNGKTVASENIYSDLNLSFKPHPITGDITRKTDVDAVKQSIKNLISTNHYERPFKPSLGANLRGKLFELDTSVFGAESMVNDIADMIRTFEPRVRDVQVTIQNNDNSAHLNVYFKVQNSINVEELEYVITMTR